MPRFSEKNILIICVSVVLIFTVSITYSQAPPKYFPYNLYPFGSTPSYPSDQPKMLNPGSDTIPLSSGMFRDYLPHFSCMDYGFLYEFSSKGFKRSQFFSNLFLPLLETRRDVWFCQVQYGYNGFSNPGTYENGSASYRVDASVGGGYRFFLSGPTIRGIGLNAFWDTSKIYGSWYGSWGAGMELVWEGYNNSLFDFSVNQYGTQFQNLEDVVDLWRKGNVNFDLEGGYSKGFYDGVADLRLKVNAYQFSLGDDQTVSGYKGGVELTTGDGLLRVAYDIGHDRDKGTYNSISTSINVGFQPEDLLSGKNPFSMPHPIFMSPERNPRRILTQKVRRNTNLPDKVVTANRKRNEPAVAYITAAINGPYTCSGTYTQSSETNGTWQITPSIDGLYYRTSASSYTLTLSGDLSAVTFPLTVTITPNVTVATGQFIVSESGVPNQPQTVTFDSPTDLVKTIGLNGTSGGSTPLPVVIRQRYAGSAGSQGTIVITGTGISTLTIDVVSGNEPIPGVAYFQVTMNGPYGFGSGTYTQSSNTSGTWNITPAIDGTNFHTSAASYTVTLSGDTSGLTFPLTATITPNSTQPTGQITVRQSGVPNQLETITFTSATDLVKTIPPNGNSSGTSPVPDVTRQRTSGSSGSQGNIFITATGVQTLTIDVVSGSEPPPGAVYFTVAMNGPYGFGSGTYTQSSNTTGTWDITPVIDGANFHTSAASYTVTLSGDTGGIAFPVTVTVTPNATQPTGQFIVQQSGTPSVAETITFANSGDLVKTIPPNGDSTGTTPVPDVIRAQTSGGAGVQGVIFVTAGGVQPLAIAVNSTQ